MAEMNKELEGIFKHSNSNFIHFCDNKNTETLKIFFILKLDLIFVEEMSIKQLWSCLMFKAIQSYVICNALNPPYILWIDDCTGLNEEFHHIIVPFSGG